jgi:hypothetical protein
MTAALPPDWATSELYLSGPDVGTPTKVDPSSPENGFIRGVIAAPQHVNFLFNKHVSASRRAFEVAALRLRTLRLDGDTNDDAQDCLAAVGQGPLTVLLTANTTGVLEIYDTDPYFVLGAFDSIDVGAAADAGGLRVATDGSRILAIGITGTDTATDFSDDGGGTWTAGGLFDNAFGSISWVVWDDVNSVFVGGSSATIFRKSSNGVAWSDLVNTNEPRSEARLACLTAGPLLGVRNTNPMTFALSTDATNWTVSGGSVANASQLASITDNCVCGALDTFYHVGRITSGALQVSSSADGATWSTLATITPASAGMSDFEAEAPRILECPNTGLLIIACRANTDTRTLLFASTDGVDWVGPHIIPPAFNPDNIAVANGRVFAKSGTQLLASDGIGVE